MKIEKNLTFFPLEIKASLLKKFKQCETFALRVYLDIFKLFKLIESHKDSEIFLGMVS